MGSSSYRWWLNISELKQLENACFLCGELKDRGGFKSVSDNLRLTGDIAPIVPDHMLLYSTEHRLSFSQLDSKAIHVSIETIDLLRNSTLFENHEMILFEHGPIKERSIAGCCDHAHIHILPVPAQNSKLSIDCVEIALHKLFEDYCSRGEFMDLGNHKLEDLPRFSHQNYVWWSRNPDDVNVFELISGGRQVLRKMFATVLGKEKFFSWDLYDLQAAKRTIKKLNSYI